MCAFLPVVRGAQTAVGSGPVLGRAASGNGRKRSCEVRVNRRDGSAAVGGERETETCQEFMVTTGTEKRNDIHHKHSTGIMSL